MSAHVDATIDRTAQLAAAAGARVIHVDLRHIAAARNAGASAASGRGSEVKVITAATAASPAPIR